MKVIAHRGASSQAPENSIKSIHLAIEQNADYVEIDVRLTKDGIPVIIHDPTIEGVAVHELTSQTIKSYEMVKILNDRVVKERIPTLNEVFQLDWKESGIMIEIKKCPQADSEVVNAVMEILIKSVKVPKKVIMGSFSLEIVKEVMIRKNQWLVPIQTIGIVEDEKFITDFLSLGVDKIAMWYPLINQRIIEQLKRHDVSIWAFTVNDCNVASSLQAIGVDGIITDVPTKILKHTEMH